VTWRTTGVRDGSVACVEGLADIDEGQLWGRGRIAATAMRVLAHEQSAKDIDDLGRQRKLRLSREAARS
jgi:hypothetical protein